jgi:glycosyltransferase involved in cell wall biosynthesis
MPVYNNLPALRHALEGVLAQTFGDFELIIADNASTEFGAADVAVLTAHDPRVRYIRHAENLGAARNFAAVLAAAQGDYFMWHGADDHITPTFLERCVDVLDARPDVVTVTCVRAERIGLAERADGFVGFEQSTAEERLESYLDTLPDRNGRFYGVYRRAALRGFRTEHFARFAADWGLFASVLAQGKSVVRCDAGAGYEKSRGGGSEDPRYLRRALTLTQLLLDPFAAFKEQLPPSLRRRRWGRLMLLHNSVFWDWMRSPTP